MTHIVFLTAWVFSLPGLNRKVPLYICSFGILLLFLSLRYGFGNDYWSYYGIHEVVNSGQEVWGNYDVLYIYLNLIVKNFYWLVTIISVFYIFTMRYLIKSNLEVQYYWFALLILLINPYLFLVHLSSFRQTIAICFVIFAVNFAVKRKLLKYVIFIVIAAGFHQSAIVLLPAYFLLSDKKINKKRFIIIFGVLSLLLLTPLFETILNRVLDYFPNYNRYVEYGAQNSLRSIVLSSFFFFLVIFNINKLEGKEIIYGKLALIATSISLLTIKVSMLSRVGMYFDIFLIIAIPLIFSKIRVKANKQLLFVIMLTIYLLRYVSFFNNPGWSFAYGTYKTILGK